MKRITWLAPLALTATASVIIAGPAQASDGTACGTATCSATFATAGLNQAWVVPSGVTTVSVTLFGAKGGTAGTVPGGAGAKVSGRLSVHAGQQLLVDVGGTTDTTDGGLNGGGGGGVGSLLSVSPGVVAGGGFGAGGGGMSDLRVGGVYQLVAGGGGGGGGAGGGDACSDTPLSAGGRGGNSSTSGASGQTETWHGITFGAGHGGQVDGAGGAAGMSSAAAGTCAGHATATFSGKAGSAGTQYQGGGSTLGGGGGGGGVLGGGQGGSGAGSAITGAQTPAVSEEAGAGGGAGGTSGGLASAHYALLSSAGNSGQVNHGNGEVVITYARPGASSGSSTPPNLANTGANTERLGLIALVLVAAGISLNRAGRRRRPR